MRLLRLRSRTRRRFSMAMTCLLTMAVERSSRSAAPTKLPDSTTWRNTLMLVSVSISGVVLYLPYCPVQFRAFTATVKENRTYRYTFHPE